jgi:2-methylisocitrate lyase-like PEP mutase family enzyme
MKSLRSLIQPSHRLVAPSVYDCVSARRATAEGVEALDTSSASASSAALGLPDLGFLNLLGLPHFPCCVSK